MIKAVLERGLQVELAEHLGYDRGDPAGRGSPNMRNGSSGTTIQSELGPLGLQIPRDRAGSFEPRLVPKGSRRIGGGLDEMIISLYAVAVLLRRAAPSRTRAADPAGPGDPTEAVRQADRDVPELRRDRCSGRGP